MNINMIIANVYACILFESKKMLSVQRDISIEISTQSMHNEHTSIIEIVQWFNQR